MRLARLSRCLLLSLALPALLTAVSRGQAKAAASHDSPEASRIDFYGGYGFWQPFDSGIAGYNYERIYNPNTTMSLTDYFSHHWGIQLEGQYFSNGYSSSSPTKTTAYGPCKSNNCDQNVYSGQIGAAYRFPHGAVTPFLHGLAGPVRMNGPAYQPFNWGYGLTFGGGLDLNLPYFNNRFSIRAIQADYQFTHENYGLLERPAPTAPINSTGGTVELDAVKLSAGLVVHFGGRAPTPLILGCAATPLEVLPGDPVTITSSTTGLKANKKPVYTWAAKGGKVTPAGPTATIDTTGLAPGQYDVVAKVSVGPNPYDQAFCSAPFTVKAYEPPVLTCSVEPSSAKPGTPVNIVSDAHSPQGRPLTYSYTSTGGQVTGNGPNARLDTAGLSQGVITVTCSVSDDEGNTTTATADITLTKPGPLKPPPSTEPLCSLSFSKDVRRPVRVDNESKACLDDIALALNRQSDATLVMVGNASPKEKSTMAAERALNARDYLTKEKGIDPARIQLRLGSSSGKTVNNLLVPAGVAFDPGTTQAFDEHAVVRHGQAYPGAHPTVRRHKASPKPKPATTTP